MMQQESRYRMWIRFVTLIFGTFLLVVLLSCIYDVASFTLRQCAKRAHQTTEEVTLTGFEPEALKGPVPRLMTADGRSVTWVASWGALAVRCSEGFPFVQKVTNEEGRLRVFRSLEPDKSFLIGLLDAMLFAVFIILCGQIGPRSKPVNVTTAFMTFLPETPEARNTLARVVFVVQGGLVALVWIAWVCCWGFEWKLVFLLLPLVVCNLLICHHTLTLGCVGALAFGLAILFASQFALWWERRATEPCEATIVLQEAQVVHSGAVPRAGFLLLLSYPWQGRTRYHAQEFGVGQGAWERIPPQLPDGATLPLVVSTYDGTLLAGTHHPRVRLWWTGLGTLLSLVVACGAGWLVWRKSRA